MRPSNHVESNKSDSRCTDDESMDIGMFSAGSIDTGTSYPLKVIFGVDDKPLTIDSFEDRHT